MRPLLQILVASVLLLTYGLAPAGPREIVVAQVAPFTGPISSYSKATNAGAAALFSAVNARGGVRGARIRFIAYDDEMDPVKTVAAFRDIARKESPVAFLYPVAPASVLALVTEKVPQTEGVSVIGTIPPMYRLRSPVNPFVFHVGSGDDAEVEKIVEHIATLGVRNVGIVYWDDPALRDTVSIVEREAARRGVAITVRVPTPPAASVDMDPFAAQVVSASPTAVVALLPLNQTAQLVAGVRKRKSTMWVYGPSYNESGALFDAAGKEFASGVAVSQVVPNPFNPRTRLVAEYQADMKRYAPQGTRLSSLSLEGYIAARLLVAALERLGPGPSAAQVRDSLEGLGPLDLGGLTASFGPNQHVALKFLDIGMVTSGGKLLY